MPTPTRTFCPALSPQPSYFLGKQKTLVCLGKWTAHIPVKIHIEPCRAGERGKEEKLDSSTNVYLFPMLAPSLNSLLLPSQREAVISLAPECVCTLTVKIFFDEKQYVVPCRGCLSFIALYSVTGNRWGMESIPLPRCFNYTHTHLPHPNKASTNESYIRDAARCVCVCLPVVHCNQSKACCHTNLTPHTARREGGGGGERLWVLIEKEVQA